MSHKEAFFSQKFGDLPFGHDHKYVYSHFGYNSKVTGSSLEIKFRTLQKGDILYNLTYLHLNVQIIKT